MLFCCWGLQGRYHTLRRIRNSIETHLRQQAQASLVAAVLCWRALARNSTCTTNGIILKAVVIASQLRVVSAASDSRIRFSPELGWIQGQQVLVIAITNNPMRQTLMRQTQSAVLFFKLGLGPATKRTQLNEVFLFFFFRPVCWRGYGSCLNRDVQESFTYMRTMLMPMVSVMKGSLRRCTLGLLNPL